MSSSRWSGKTLGGRYQIEELLGQGGMSAVYKAIDPNLNRAVSIKLIHPHLADDEEFVRRFQKEAAVVAQLRHPNIVQVFDFDRDGDDFYMVMEFLPGITLGERLEDGDIPLSDVVKYAVNICDAADYAHRQSLIHRDIKPDNVMLNQEDDAILMDFGIAKILGDPKFTATGATVGTALYMSPEQIRGQNVDDRSDIYSIGVVLFEMISGQPPFQAESPMTMLMMHLTDPVPDLNQLSVDCPDAIKLIVEKAMAKESDLRYQSAAEMSAALSQSVGSIELAYSAPTDLGTAAVVAANQNLTDQAYAGEDSSPLQASPTPSAVVHSAAYEDELHQKEELPESDFEGRSKKPWVIGGGLLLAAAFILICGLAIFLFSQLGSKDGEGQTAADLPPTEEVPAFIPPANTESPTIEPTPTATTTLEETLAPTSSPTPTAISEPSPTATAVRMGLLAFQDNEAARAGSFQLIIAEANSPAPGSHYEIWLSDGVVTDFVGIIEPGSGINFTNDSSENLLALYNSVIITVEPDDHSGGAPSGDPIFVGFIPPGSLDQIRLLVAAAPESPQGKAYLIGATEQALVAIDHSGFLLESLASTNLSGAKQHAEHVVNILAGEESSAFGDLNGDGQAQNPGDGFGLAVYLEKAKEHAQLATTADNSSEEIKLHGEHTIIGIENSLSFLDDAIQAAGRVIASDTADEAQLAADILSSSLDAMLRGDDANSDGIITPLPGEGGILVAYEHALKMGSFELLSP